ncbi:hypothetical protein F0726_00545 [Acidithiobacillus caldus]|nr:hypothetical protein F0726_00545 [Acidithiobacillus caldus]
MSAHESPRAAKKDRERPPRRYGGLSRILE